MVSRLETNSWRFTTPFEIIYTIDYHNDTWRCTTDPRGLNWEKSITGKRHKDMPDYQKAKPLTQSQTNTFYFIRPKTLIDSINVTATSIMTGNTKDDYINELNQACLSAQQIVGSSQISGWIKSTKQGYDISGYGPTGDLSMLMFMLDFGNIQEFFDLGYLF